MMSDMQVPLSLDDARRCGMPHFLDERVGCVGVREVANTDPDYQGLHHDTPGVVHFQCFTVDGNGGYGGQEIAEARTVCRRLNMEQKEEVVSGVMSFGQAMKHMRSNPGVRMQCHEDWVAVWHDGHARIVDEDSSGCMETMAVDDDCLDATWHVVETEAERVKREHYELLVLARDVAGPKPWNKGEIVPRGTTFARNVLEKLGLD